MNRNIVDAFAIVGAVFTVIGVAIAIYFGYRSLTQPGLTIEGIDELNSTSQENSQISSEIRDAVTSEDAVEALFKRGYELSAAGFLLAIDNRDVKTIDLFCLSPAEKLIGDNEFIFSQRAISLRDDVARKLTSCPAFDVEAVCSPSPIPRSTTITLLPSESADIAKLLCPNFDEIAYNLLLYPEISRMCEISKLTIGHARGTISDPVKADERVNLIRTQTATRAGNSSPHTQASICQKVGLPLPN